LGGFLSYFHASRDFLDGGNGSTNAFSVGTYATWIDPKGWYADLVLKYTQLWNYFHTPASDGSVSTENYSIPSLGGSLEVGKRFDVGRFFIEPQAQLAGVWEAGNNYTASNGLMVGGSDQFSLRGRLGLRAGTVGWISWLGLDIPISASRSACKPITLPSIRRAPSW
jgi:tracheal colonization factor